MAKAQTPPVDRKQALADKIVKLQRRGAKIYGQIDPLLGELVAAAKHGEQFTVDGDVYEFTDNFAGDKTKVFKRTAFARYELKRANS